VSGTDAALIRLPVYTGVRRVGQAAALTGANARTSSRRSARPAAHEPRHAAAPLASATGADIQAAQKMLGHSSAVMTLAFLPTCSTISTRSRPPDHGGRSTPVVKMESRDHPSASPQQLRGVQIRIIPGL